MSDRFYLGEIPEENPRMYDRHSSSGAELRKMLRDGNYGGFFKLHVGEDATKEELEAFFPDDDLWWPPVDEFTVYFRDNELPSAETVDELWESIQAVRIESKAKGAA